LPSVVWMSAHDPEEALSEPLVKQRAKSGVFFVGSWGAVNLIVGFAGSIVLARMLTPSDFGVVAIGTTLMMVTTALADGGLASGLIRRDEPPSRGELGAALTLQLGLTLVLAVVAAGAGFALGGSGDIVALMMIALPISAFQTPGRIVLSRSLRFRALATADAIGFISYYAWAVGGVVAGLGVWALASAVILKAVVAAVGVGIVSRLGLLPPSVREMRSLSAVIPFGLRFQAVSLAGMVREQGLNIGIAAISGVSALGFWTLTRRLLEFPVLMFEPLHRVVFPLMSHMRAGGQDPGRLIDRGVAVAGTAAGVVLVTGMAAAPELVPAIFGEQWRSVAPIFQWVCAALLVAGPLAVVAVGFLYALDVPQVVLRITVVHTLVLWIVALGLLPVIGPTAIGIGSLAGAVVDMLLMARAVRVRSEARPLRQLLPTLAAAAIAAAAGIVVTNAVALGLIGAVAGGATAAAVYLAALAIGRRAVLLDTAGLVVGAVRSGLSREPQQPPADAAPAQPSAAPAPS
jgi:O-antigen/teichoic acid export membrane protein